MEWNRARVTGYKPEYKNILTEDALAFLTALVNEFSRERERLLQRRVRVQRRIDSGVLPDFLKETEGIRKRNWKVSPVPQDLRKRWVEITGPAGSRKMVINALNSGADVYMADAEDSESPLFDNIIQGQINLRDAIRGTIAFSSGEKEYKLNEKTATLMFRPRGWHLVEKNVLIDNEPVSASLFDFAMYFFHNVKTLMDKGSGPYFYLPKMESRYEARLWNNVFRRAQELLRIPEGTIKATVLVETILAAFEMDEILYELRKHSAGLNCGRWDYIFSFIKKFRNYPNFVLPDRAMVTMDKGFLAAYVNLLIQTCHKRGAYAMGGMAAQIPIKNDPEANERALEKVRADKIREVRAGHDGTWVAHPGLVPVARKVFSAWLDSRVNPAENQLGVLRNDVEISAKDLLQVPEGAVTEAGLRTNIRVGIEYLTSWLMGNGCVPINNLMEDAATAEISRSQIWQWLKHGAKLDTGEKITPELVRRLIQEELPLRKNEDWYLATEKASKLFEAMSTSETFPEFLTVPAYELLPNSQ